MSTIPTRRMPAGHHVRPMPPVAPDLTCVICGLDCDSPLTHHESWRDLGHRPLVVEELEATPDSRRLAGSSPGLRGSNGARR